MWKNISCVIILGLVALDLTNAFSLTKQEPNPTLTVKEGGSFELSCEVDNYYEYCKFIQHSSVNLLSASVRIKKFLASFNLK